MMPQSFYYCIVPAVAAVLILVFYALSIVCSSSVKQLVVAERMKRGKFRRMPVKMYTKPESYTEEEEECSVCLSAFTDGQLVRHLQRCRHSFHVACIDKWLTSHCTCPVCRSDLLLSGQEAGAASEV